MKKAKLGLEQVEDGRSKQKMLIQVGHPQTRSRFVAEADREQMKSKQKERRIDFLLVPT